MRIRPLDFDTEWRRAHPFPWGRNDCVNPFVCHFGTSQHSTTETKNNDPWGPQQPYLTQGFQMAGSLAGQSPPQQQNPVVGFNGIEDQALQGIAGRATSGAPIAGAANNFSTDLLNGNYLNSNPALGYFASLAGNNLGLNNPGASALSRLANTNGSYFAPGNSTLDFLSRNNVGANNPGTALLERLASTNPGTSAPGAGTLFDLSGKNLGIDNSGTPTLSSLAGTNLGVDNGGTPTLNKYASGGYFNNGYTGDVAQSVMASVVPKIAAQFNQGNAINNPLAARSAAEGVTSALAPLEYANYQAQEQLQQDAAQKLATNKLAGGQLQQGAAQSLAGNTLQGESNQGTFANLAASLGLTGAQLQGALGQDVAGNFLTGANTSAGAASTLGANFLTGRQQQLGAAGDLSQGAVAGGGLQATAAKGMSDPYQDTIAKMVQSQALAPQTQAMNYADLEKLFGVGQAYQSQGQNEASGQAATYNFSQMSPYEQLAAYMQAVTGNYGGTSTDTKPYYTNDTANTLGTVSGIASTAAMILPFL